MNGSCQSLDSSKHTETCCGLHCGRYMAGVDFQVAQGLISHFPFHASFCGMAPDSETAPFFFTTWWPYYENTEGDVPTTFQESISGDFGCNRGEATKAVVWRCIWNTVESLGMHLEEFLPRVTARCNILLDFHAPVLLSAALLIPYSAAYRLRHSVFMHFMFLLPTVKHCLSCFCHFLIKHLKQQQRVGGERWKWRSLHSTSEWDTADTLYTQDSRVPLRTRCAAAQDASLLNFTIIRSESAGRTGEMRKRTHMTDHRAAEETFSSHRREHRVRFWNKDIYDCLPLLEKKRAWLGFD